EPGGRGPSGGMFHLIKRAARRVLGPHLASALKRLVRHPAAAAAARGGGAAAAGPCRAAGPGGPSLPAAPEEKPCPANALPPAPGPRPVRPAHPPRKLPFLSDCYGADVVWGPSHKTMLAYCGAAHERVLAIRTNAFFHPWSHRPCSEAHLAHVREQIRAFAPDLVFSINRAGLCDEALEGV